MKFGFKESFKKAFASSDIKNHKIRLIIQIAICIIIIFFGIISFVLLSSISHKPNIKLPELLLKSLITVPVEIKDYRYEFTGYGTVKPATEISVSSEIKGEVIYKSPFLEEGNFATKGDILLKINDIDYRLALKEAETEIISLGLKIKMTTQDISDGKDMLLTKEKSLELDEIDLKRKEKLKEKDAISSRSLEEARKQVSTTRHEFIKERNLIANYELQLQSSKADLAKAEVKQAQAEKNLDKTIIKAPISGRLENVSISKDEYVSPGTFLFEINDRDVIIDVPIEIEDALYLMDFVNKQNKSKAGTNDWFKLVKDISVTIYWTGDFNLCKWSGKILRVKKFDAETRTLTLRVEPIKYIGQNDQTIPLVEGMFCKMDFIGKVIKNTVKVPWAALQLNGGVYVVDNNGIVSEKYPKILNSNNNEIIISADGLKQGEHIVAQRIPQNVVTGSKVNILTLKD